MPRAGDRLSGLVERRLTQVARDLLGAFPVVVLTGPRTVGKSVLIRRLATEFNVPVIDLDDLDVRRSVTDDPQAFVDGARPVCIDEFQHVPEVLDAIKAELNRDWTAGQFVLTGSTQYSALPRTAQSLTGRATIVPVWPLSQGEIDGVPESLVMRLLAGDIEPAGPSAGRTTRDEYASRVLAGGYPQALGLPEVMRDRWFADYVTLVCERDVIALSKVRQRAQLPVLLTSLAGQTAQLLNMSEAARSVRLEVATAENYTKLLEAVFLVHRLPAWGTTLGSKAGALPKLHLVDTGVAASLLGVTAEKLARRLQQALTEYGHVLETFVVNEVFKQVSWNPTPVRMGHWRDRGGAEVDLVLERGDGSVLGIEVKASSRVQPVDAFGLKTMAKRVGERWLGGVVFYTGQHSVSLDKENRVIVLPIDALCR